MKNQLRIIAGKWRGRKLNFVNAQGLRPTPDRVRETVFNWLQAVIYDAKCLDLYSGSGALGFEALSRGAANVTMVDNNRQVISRIRQNLQLLSCDNAKAICMDAFAFLSQNKALESEQKYQLIFLDPPFGKGVLSECCQKIEQNQLLSDNSYIYIEAEKDLKLDNIPDNWSKIREKQAGQLAYYLFYKE